MPIRYMTNLTFFLVLTVVQAFIISCPNYCKSFLMGAPAFTLASLSSFQHMVVIFYTIIANTVLMNTEPLLLQEI